MTKISCDICTDLIPLVKDEVASEDSKKAVLEHINTCEKCKNLYGEEFVFQNSDKAIISKLKKNLIFIAIGIISLATVFGISLSASEFMFYNILIMPTIGAISYISLKKKFFYSCIGVFLVVYLRFLYDSFGYALNGSVMQAFIPPLYWAIIYLGLTLFGVLIAFLLNFGFKKEVKYEKDK